MDLFFIHFSGKGIFMPEKKQLKKRKKLQSAIESLNTRFFRHLDFVFSCDIAVSTPLPRRKRLPRWCSTSENDPLYRSGKRKRGTPPPPDRRVITFQLLGKPSAGPSPPRGTSRSESDRCSSTTSGIPSQLRGESCPHALGKKAARLVSKCITDSKCCQKLLKNEPKYLFYKAIQKFNGFISF